MTTTKIITTLAMLLAIAVATHAEDAPLLRSLPTEVQGEVEDVRARCREHIDSVEGSGYAPQVVTSGDDGLIQFTLSGTQAVMIDHVVLCGGASFKGVNYTNRGSHSVVVYVRSGNSWRKDPLDRRGRESFPERRRQLWIQGFGDEHPRWQQGLPHPTRAGTRGR